MAEKTAIETAIETNADGPQSVTNDGVSVSQRSVRDMIEADRYLEAKKQQRAGKRGVSVAYRGGSSPT